MKEQHEQLAPILNVNTLPAFPLMWRARFGSDRRVYYRKGFNRFYSGVTTAIKNSGLIDYSGLNKARVNMAFDGVEADVVWGEKRDYGTVYHTLVSMHERRDSERREFVFGDETELGIAWRSDVYGWANKYGYPEFAETWCDQVQNDMASWFLFKRESNVEVLASEIIVYNDNWLIATPLDIVCEMDFGKGRILAGINIKTGTSDGKEYALQVCMEQKLWNDYMKANGGEKYLLTGTFTWRPKDRDRAPGKYELSKNYSGVHSDAEMQHIANGVVLNRLNEPRGSIKTYKGTEKDFTVEIVTAQQYLEQFNQQQ